MKVVVADQAGVCFGVNRALDLVDAEVEKRGELATLGPLIHNPQVVRMLEEKGARVVTRVEDAATCIVMPSHGVPRSVFQAAEAAGLEIIDATCPFVANVEKRARTLLAEGYLLVVVGDAGHSEVKAIKGSAGEECLVIGSPEEVDQLKWSGKRVGIVSQTTQKPENFGEVVGRIAARAKEVHAYNTICYATHDRQESARKLAAEVDAMVVVGGRNSANTNRLAEICREVGVPTFHIETAEEIRPEWFEGVEVVGLTAGASTPEWIIDDVRKQLETL